MSKAFATLWLRADTFISGLQPWQYRRVRALCEKFFEKGRRFERGRAAVVSSVNNQQRDGDEDAGRKS